MGSSLGRKQKNAETGKMHLSFPGEGGYTISVCGALAQATHGRALRGVQNGSLRRRPTGPGGPWKQVEIEQWFVRVFWSLW